MRDSRRADAIRSRSGRAGAKSTRSVKNAAMEAAADYERRYDAARTRGDWDEARRWLEMGASAGDPFACGQLGVWCLLGHIVDRDDEAGFRLVRMAARAGRPEARPLLATLYARGRGVDESWTKAVDWLVRGAQFGDPACMRQLAFLLPRALVSEQRTLLRSAATAGDLVARRKLARLPTSDVPPARIEWKRIKRVARRPDVPEGAVEVVRETPSIRVRRGVLSQDLCDYLICVAAPYLTRARVNDPERGAELVSQSRTNSFANFWLLEGDVVTDCVDRMLARLVGAPPPEGEPMSVLHYAPGEQFAPHFDYFDPDTPVHAAQLAVGGQRIATCLVFLNAGYEGGATAFVDIRLQIRGEQGAALYWRNVGADGAPDRMTRHAGLPPASGEKWILSKWFRDRPQTQARAPSPTY
jgi:prolyl 4-hydroxylase